MTNKRKIVKKFFISIFLIILILFTAIALYITLKGVFFDDNSNEYVREELTKVQKDSAILAAATAERANDTIVQVIRVSNKADLEIKFDYDEQAGQVKKIFTGRRI